MSQQEKYIHEELEKISSESRPKTRAKMKERIFSFTLTFILMYILWFILSGKTDVLLLVLGAIASLTVTMFSSGLLFPNPRIGRYSLTLLKFLQYPPWPLYQIFMSNIHLIYLVFHPRMKEKINPHIIYFQTGLKKDMSIVSMANTITLTPGTITVNATPDGYFKVHALDYASAAGLPGRTEKILSRVFEE